MAVAFLSEYASLFGLDDAVAELAITQQQTLEDGRAIVRLQQQYEGIPIIGGELQVHLTRNGDVISVNGETLPGLDLDTEPAIAAARAEAAALATVMKQYGMRRAELQVSRPELWIFNPALLGGPGARLDRLVWRVEVTPRDLHPVRQLVLVDAQTGAVVLDFNQVAHAKDRVIYDNNNNPAAGLPGTGPVRTEGGPATGISDVDLAYDYAGDTYDFFFNQHGRDSLDDMGMTLISTVRYCEPGELCPFPNAFWNGQQMAYGDGFAAADDVVGHELTHGVTDFSSELFYYYQSGAINESLSDVWGEFIDQTNSGGTDTPAVRWRMGEDVPGFGAIRNMQNPPEFGDPDRIGSPIYHCEPTDSGGVHINSGVNNKAAYLMTDGGSFNGQTVTGLGIPKVADLYYEVQTTMLTSGSDYPDLYDYLLQAAINLGYSASERQAIEDALNAVEMNTSPADCTAPEAEICPAGQLPADLFFDDLETGDSNWTQGVITGSEEWYIPMLPNPYAFGPYATSGSGNIWGYNQGATSDSFVAMNSDVMLPANAYLHFNHAFDFEFSGGTAWDGGVLEYSTNGGTTWQDAGALLTENGYTGTISNFNPLAGRDGFVNASFGYMSSRASPNSLAGQNIRFRFRIGTDSLFDAFGWFIDDVRIYTCTAGPTPTSTAQTPTGTATALATSTATTEATSTAAAPTATATAQATSSATVQVTSTAPAATSTVTAQATSSATAQVTSTATRTATRTASTPTSTSTHTAMPTSTTTSIPGTVTHTPTSTASGTPTSTSTHTVTTTATRTATPEPTHTATAVPALTGTPTSAITPEPTPTATAIPSLTATLTSETTSTATRTPSHTPTIVPVTATQRPTGTPIITLTSTSSTPTEDRLYLPAVFEPVRSAPTATPTFTPLPTMAPSSTSTPAPPVTLTPTSTPTPTNTSVPTATAAPPTPTTGQFYPILNGDFEQGRVGWQEYSQNGWILIYDANTLPVPPHGGNWAAWLGEDHNEYAELSQPVTVSPSTPYLSLWLWIASEDDGCTVEDDVILVGFNDELLHGLPLCSSTNTGGWVQTSLDMQPVAGRVGLLRIAVITDASALSAVLLDDISFQGQGSTQLNATFIDFPEVNLSRLPALPRSTFDKAAPDRSR